MNLSDAHVIRDEAGNATDYVFIDPTGITHYPVPDRNAFTHAVSFSMVSRIDMNYPVVFVDDLTTSHGKKLQTIAYADVPTPIKRKLTNWLKLQSAPASGPSTPKLQKPKRQGGSDAVKEAIASVHADTRSSDWKRRSRTRCEDGIRRRFEHEDGRIVDTTEHADGRIEIHAPPGRSSVPEILVRPDARYQAIEIFVAGPKVDELTPSFEQCGDNPNVVELFRSGDLHTGGEYDGDGCDRLEVTDGIVWAGMDGLATITVIKIAEECRACALRNPELSYLVVGHHPVGDDEIQSTDVLLIRGFDASNNPMRRLHGRFYEDYVVRGI